ncbi:MAG TPA: F0F1 ATP synthase subunit A [Candidatus Omnitrophota bacterium]|nr:F0F1 ATP synthase subunit A [Candidatus Omnitrophota bacterium]HPS36206.1 F0F1 ATP synthase subunit A [Candidatus Omnitrophota bacterium]
MNVSSINEAAQTVHAAADHGAEQAAEELPNFITVLEHFFPKSSVVQFLAHWQNLVFSFLVLSLIAYTALRAAQKKNFLPKGVQNIWEMFVEAITGFVTGILGPKGAEHVPFLGTVFLYILLQNWLGMIPLMKSPTSAWSTTIALALITMVYIQWVGIKEQGFLHYLKHMAGNPVGILGLCLIPIMLVINLSIEFLAVPLSLSLRLFANVSSEDKLIFKFAELNALYYFVPFFFQIFANVLVVIFSLVQAFVFLLLSTVYISLIMPHGEHEDVPRGREAH